MKILILTLSLFAFTTNSYSYDYEPGLGSLKGVEKKKSGWNNKTINSNSTASLPCPPGSYAPRQGPKGSCIDKVSGIYVR